MNSNNLHESSGANESVNTASNWDSTINEQRKEYHDWAEFRHEIFESIQDLREKQKETNACIDKLEAQIQRLKADFGVADNEGDRALQDALATEAARGKIAVPASAEGGQERADEDARRAQEEHWAKIHNEAYNNSVGAGIRGDWRISNNASS